MEEEQVADEQQVADFLEAAIEAADDGGPVQLHPDVAVAALDVVRDAMRSAKEKNDGRD